MRWPTTVYSIVYIGSALGRNCFDCEMASPTTQHLVGSRAAALTCKTPTCKTTKSLSTITKMAPYRVQYELTQAGPHQVLVYTYVGTLRYTNAYAQLYEYAYAHVHTCLHTCLYTSLYICLHTCPYTQRHITTVSHVDAHRAELNATDLDKYLCVDVCIDMRAGMCMDMCV